MVVYADKAAFTNLGLERITPSTSHLSQDCYICTHPLDVVPTPTPPASSTARAGTEAHIPKDSLSPEPAVGIVVPTSTLPATATTGIATEHRSLHAAVRITDCGHMHGAECLDAWLDVSNTCPTCKRLLFENMGSEITNADVQAIVSSLGPLFGVRNVLMAVHRCVHRHDGKLSRVRLTREEETARREREAKSLADLEAAVDADWIVSDGEGMDFEFEDEDEDEDESDGMDSECAEDDSENAREDSGYADEMEMN